MKTQGNLDGVRRNRKNIKWHFCFILIIYLQVWNIEEVRGAKLFVQTTLMSLSQLFFSNLYVQN